MPVFPTMPLTRFRVVRQKISDSGAFFLDIAFPKKPGGRGRVTVPRGLLLDTRKARVFFADHGATLPADCAAVFNELLEQQAPIIRVVSKTGWHHGAYLSRFGRIGGSGLNNVELDAAVKGSRERFMRGDGEAFKAAVAPLLAASPFLMLAYLAALAAPMAASLNLTSSFAICFSAESSTGKTSCLRLAQALTTRADEADLENFGNTTGILLDALPVYGGQAVSFGDLKADLRSKDVVEKLRTLTFAAAGGAPRQRKGEAARPTPDFNILLFSAEAPLHDLFAASGVPFEDGEAVRLLDVPVPPRDQGGIFREAEAPADLIALLDAALRNHHGVIIKEWIGTLANYKPKVLTRDVQAQRKRFVEQLGALPAHHARIAEHFGVLAAAGALGIKSGALPLTQDTVNQALAQLFRSVVDRIGSRDVETVAAWTAFLNLVERLPILEEGARAPMPKLAGFRRKQGTGSETVYLRRDALTELAGESVFAMIILPALVRAGCVPATGEKTVAIAQNGLLRARYYRISASSLNTLRDELAPLFARLRA